MNLILAIIWLLLGITVLVWQTVTGDDNWALPLGNYRFSYGWLMLLFVVYNLRRWWTVRATQLQRRHLQMELATRQRNTRWNDRQKPQDPPDPEFQFTDEPPPPPGTDSSDRPAPPGS
jgi:hypothetical protein